MDGQVDLTLTYDLCIIGSGPAGMILALEHSRLDPQKKVLLIDYGYEGQPVKNTLDDTIKNLNPVNHHDPYECTNKGFGGSTATWGGRCVMYDKIDFTERDVIWGKCTWNEALFNDINNYLSIAAQYFECGEAVFDLHDIDDIAYKPIAENFIEGVVTDSVIERWSIPTRFGSRYAQELGKCSNITFVQGYESRGFATPDENGHVISALIREVISHKTHEVKAAKFVIAAGGQETTRLLLRNPDLFNNLDAPPSALGKFYQGHLSGKIASVKFNGDPKKTDYGFLVDADGTYLRRRFQFNPEFLIEQNLLNMAMWLDNPLYFDHRHNSGAMSLMYLAMITPFIGRKLAPPAIAYSITKGKVTGIGKHLLNVVKDLPYSLSTPVSIFLKRYISKRKLPGVFLYSKQNKYALHFHAEQIPEEANKMTLGVDNETLVIDYGITDTDIDSVIKLHETLDKWLRDHNCGELEYWFKKEDLPNAIKTMSRDGLHQCGTTRIASSPADGVVDNDLLLWGTNNVFVCSSSVFPTSGQANPTFMLGAFSARLAEHLTKNL